MPFAERRRAWLVNLESDPHLTFHLKDTVSADLPATDLPATARVITDDAERRSLAEWIVAHAWPNQDVDKMTAHAPMIEVTIDDIAA